MEKAFSGQAAIVTGAGQGIGFEVARRLAEAGAGVIINDLDEQLALEAAARITAAHNARCYTVAGNSGSLQIISELVNRAVAEFGRLDIVIANAGITLFGDFLSYPPESFFRVLEVNLGGSFFLAQAAARQMIKQGNGGSILFTSSVTGHQAHKNLAAYGMTKAALEMLAKNLVVELSEHRIRVNTVAPGATKTERTLEDRDYEKTWSTITPLGMPADVTDIAEAILFLVSGKAKHITGQTLIVDGGWTSVSPSPY